MEIKNKKIISFFNQYPNYMNNQKEQEEFLKLINETTKSENENREKIVKNICNELYLDKD